LRILLIVNAFATSVTPRNTVQVHQYLARHHDVQVVETSERGHATRFARDAVERGLDAVIAFGGDGTLNEVATGLAGSTTALGVLPGGSTNVFARSIGLANDPLVAITQLAAGLDAGALASISMGMANDRYFTFHCGVGYDAAVVRAVERTATFKRFVGQPLFAFYALSGWFRTYDRKHPHFTLSVDGRHIPNGYFTVVMNTSPYTYVGKRAIRLSADASLDAQLAVVTFRRLRTTQMLRALLRSVRGYTLTAQRGIDIAGNASEIVFDFPAPFDYQLDGDWVGETTRLVVRHCPDALRLVQPRHVDY
jgi:diacylglycerol kinase family enzyme